MKENNYLNSYADSVVRLLNFLRGYWKFWVLFIVNQITEYILEPEIKQVHVYFSYSYAIEYNLVQT